jgi:hypothetical protein
VSARRASPSFATVLLAIVAICLGACGGDKPPPPPAVTEPLDPLKQTAADNRELLVTVFDLRINNKVGARGELPPNVTWAQLGYVARVRNDGRSPLLIEVLRVAKGSDPAAPVHCLMRSQSHGFGAVRFDARTSQDFGNAAMDSGVDCGEGDEAPLAFRVFDENGQLIWVSESLLPQMLGLSMSDTLAVLSRLRPDGTLTD